MRCPRNSIVHVGAAGRAALLLALLLALPVTASAGSGRAASSWSGAGTTGRSKSLDAMEGDWGATGSAPSSAPKFGTGASKSTQGGYSAQRVQRFWSHYHGNRREAKSKPLERTH